MWPASAIHVTERSADRLMVIDPPDIGFATGIGLLGLAFLIAGVVLLYKRWIPVAAYLLVFHGLAVLLAALWVGTDRTVMTFSEPEKVVRIERHKWFGLSRQRREIPLADVEEAIVEPVKYYYRIVLLLRSGNPCLWEKRRFDRDTIPRARRLTPSSRTTRRPGDRDTTSLDTSCGGPPDLDGAVHDRGAAPTSVTTLGSWVSLSIDLQELRRVDVRVALRGRELHVAEQFLDRAQVGAALQQVRRKRMPQRMRRDAEARAARRDVLGNEALDAPPAEARAAEIHEQRVHALRTAQKGAIGEPGANRLLRRLVEGDQPFLRTFPEHAHDAAAQVHIFEIEADKLAEAQA